MSQLIEKKTQIMFMLLHLWNISMMVASTRNCYLKKVFTHHLVKKLFIFLTNINFTINNLIIEKLFAEKRFLKKTSTWLLLRSKFYSEFDSMICLHKVRTLQKGFSQLSFKWSVKWWVSLKLWNNHSRDWINNFPAVRKSRAL